ncbi:MAG: ATP-binding protein [Acidimicrobiales bacterium]
MSSAARNGAAGGGDPNGVVVGGVVVGIKVFPASAPACRAARRFVRTAVEEAGNSDEVADAAELICGELAANAVRHARSVFVARVACGSRGVRVSVADEARPPASARTKSAANPLPVSTTRGLGIVSSLAVDWGVDDQAHGKVVWAEIGLGATSNTAQSYSS